MVPTDALTAARAWPAAPASPRASGNRVPATRRTHAPNDPALLELLYACQGGVSVWARADSSSASAMPQTAPAAETAAAVVRSATRRVENIRTSAH